MSIVPEQGTAARERESAALIRDSRRTANGEATRDVTEHQTVSAPTGTAPDSEGVLAQETAATATADVSRETAVPARVSIPLQAVSPIPERLREDSPRPRKKASTA